MWISNLGNKFDFYVGFLSVVFWVLCDFVCGFINESTTLPKIHKTWLNLSFHNIYLLSYLLLCSQIESKNHRLCLRRVLPLLCLLSAGFFIGSVLLFADYNQVHTYSLQSLTFDSTVSLIHVSVSLNPVNGKHWGFFIFWPKISGWTSVNVVLWDTRPKTCEVCRSKFRSLFLLCND